MPTPSDTDENPLPPDPEYQWRLSNDIEGEDWEFLNAEHERTGAYGDVLDEKIDLEFRLHDLKEKLGVIPPTPPKKTASPPPPTKAEPKRNTQTPPAPKAQPAPPPPKAETPPVQPRVRTKPAPANPSPPRILITAPPQIAADTDAEAEVEGHPS